MKFINLSLTSLLALAVKLATAEFIEPGAAQVVINLGLEEPKYLIDIAGVQKWVTEDEKWKIRRVH